MQGVEYSGVVEAAQPVWPEDMSHTMQETTDEGVDTFASLGRVYVHMFLRVYTFMVELHRERREKWK